MKAKLDFGEYWVRKLICSSQEVSWYLLFFRLFWYWVFRWYLTWRKSDKFYDHNAPLKAILFDYYLNFIPYYMNMLSPLFTFIAVIFFTSKMAGNTEIIAILASGVSFRENDVAVFYFYGDSCIHLIHCWRIYHPSRQQKTIILWKSITLFLSENWRCTQRANGKWTKVWSCILSDLKWQRIRLSFFVGKIWWREIGIPAYCSVAGLGLSTYHWKLSRTIVDAISTTWENHKTRI